MQADDKARRLALYRRNEVRRLIDYLLKGSGEIRPQRDPGLGDYVLEGMDGFGVSEPYALLDELEADGVLEKYRIDSVPTCPKCDHSNFFIDYVCPYCQHRNLDRAPMIEHYSCGNTDFESNFKSGKDLICPKCSGKLKLIGTDYRKMDCVYRCIGCKRYFGTPNIELTCRMCRSVVPTAEARMTPIFAYRLNEKLRGELMAHCALQSPIISVLKELGYETKAPWSEKGLSGTTHTLDIYAQKENSEVVIDMTSGPQEIGPESIVAFFGKIYDLKPRRAILVAIPRLSADAQRLSTLYKIDVVSGASVQDLAQGLRELLGKAVTPIPSPQIAKEDWFDEVDLRSLRDKMATVMDRSEKALKE